MKKQALRSSTNIARFLATAALKTIKMLILNTVAFYKFVIVRKQLRAFLFGLALGVFFMSQFGVVSVQKVYTGNVPESANVILVSESKPIKAPTPKRDWRAIDFVSLPYLKKVDLLKKRLVKIGVPKSEIATYVRIATNESCKHQSGTTNCMNPSVTPYTEVRHCQRQDGSYFVVEISNGYQASCGSAKQVRSEKSLGIFQILPSTWKGHECKGDAYSWLDQVDCAKKIRDLSGFTQWSTY